jgi:PAS domain S-box-containing protein
VPEATDQVLGDVIDNLPGFFFLLTFDVNDCGRYKIISRGIERISGYVQHEILGSHHQHQLLSIIPDDDRQEVLDNWRRSRETLTPYRIEHRLRTRSGQTRWLRATAIPTPAGNGNVWAGLSIDVTSEKVARE